MCYSNVRGEVMREFISLLTSNEAIVIYIVAAIACFLAFIIYLIDKSYIKRKQRHNTKELNKLVEEVSEVINEEKEKTPVYNEPILEPIAEENATPLVEKENVVVAQPVENVDNVVLENLNNLVTEPIDTKKEDSIENVSNINTPRVEPIEELEYTSIEPNPEEAKEELRKLAIELEEEEKNNSSPSIISNYEEEQESNAIISLEELVKKSKEMYAANELSQYKDEGNEPISLADLEKAKQTNSTPIYDEPFIIANVVSDMEEKINNVKPVQIEQLEISDFNESNATELNEESLQDTYVKPKVEELYQTAKFKKSPVISPIYGIEKSEDDYLELENTANYDKLDEEIRKTNEFLMTLRELQKNLD